MGKKLVIKGADFSANGFALVEQVTDASTLYYYAFDVDGHPDLPLTAEVWANFENGNSIYSYEKTDGTFKTSRSVTSKIVRAVASCVGYDKVRVKTMGGLSPQSTVAGTVVLLFTDDEDNIKGGYTTMAANGTSPSGKTEGVGVPSSLTQYEMNVPAGATKVYSCYRNTTGSPFVAPDIFEMKLIKYVVE